MMERQKRHLGARWSELLAALFIVAFLLPNVIALVVPYEEFPYSSAPMFAHYVGEGTPRYRFRFVAEFGDGQNEQEIRAGDLGLAGIEFTRYFFGSVYGPIDSRSPFGHHRGDTREAFEERLSNFFGGVAAVLERNDPASWQQISRFRLEVARLDRRNRDGEIHIVGHYNAASGRFTHTWGNLP